MKDIDRERSLLFPIRATISVAAEGATPSPSPTNALDASKPATHDGRKFRDAHGMTLAKSTAATG